jgi:hypothetical protein
VVLQLTVFWYSGAVLGHEEEEEGGLYCRSATRPQNNTTRLRTKGHVCLGLGVLAWGPCCSIGFSFSPNGALEFVLFCGRLAVSQYNFLFIHSTELCSRGVFCFFSLFCS